jgi:hypothetical protein
MGGAFANSPIGKGVPARLSKARSLSVTAQRIPILITTDCEPELRETTPGVAAPWRGFEWFFDFMSTQREMIAERTGAPARFSWFWRMDQQIERTYGCADWGVRTYARQIAEAERCGDETGLHTHAWRWDDAIGRWIADNGNAAWVEHCLRASFAEFARAFGRPCQIFRFGDGWLDDRAVRLLEELGTTIDVTVEPGLPGGPSFVADEISTGMIPDRRSVPRWPYRPSRADFRKPDPNGDARLWMLPLSTGRLSRTPWRLLRLLRARAWGMALKGGAAHLNLGIDPGQFVSLFDRAVSSGHAPYAAISARTDVGAHEGLKVLVARNIRRALSHRLADRFVFTTPTDALAMLTSVPSPKFAHTERDSAAPKAS